MASAPQRGLGPARIAGIVGMPASTVHRVLVRHGLNRLDHLDRVTGRRSGDRDQPAGRARPRRRQEAGPDPPGGGWRIHGRAARPTQGRGGRPRLGYAFVHTAIDAYSRLAYSEVLATSKAPPRRVLAPSRAFFAAHGITIERVLTDNGSCYRSRDFAAALGDINHTLTRPYRPATNGKVERFNRTLLAEWAYARPWSSDGQRARALTAGSTATTITATTPPSAAHPSAESATCPGTTGPVPLDFRGEHAKSAGARGRVSCGPSSRAVARWCGARTALRPRPAR